METYAEQYNRTAVAYQNRLTELRKAANQDPYVARCMEIYGARVAAYSTAAKALRDAEDAETDAYYDHRAGRITHTEWQAAVQRHDGARNAESIAQYWVDLGRDGYEAAVKTYTDRNYR